MNINKCIEEINRNGITIIKNIFSKKKCDEYVKKSEILFKSLLKKKKSKYF